VRGWTTGRRAGGIGKAHFFEIDRRMLRQLGVRALQDLFPSRASQKFPSKNLGLIRTVFAHQKSLEHPKIE
jgi:hypothetical protein